MKIIKHRTKNSKLEKWLNITELTKRKCASIYIDFTEFMEFLLNIMA